MTTPLFPGSLLPPCYPMTDAVSNAEYAGAISRWCALTNNAPDVSHGRNKTADEFQVFQDHLKAISESQTTDKDEEDF